MRMAGGPADPRGRLNSRPSHSPDRKGAPMAMTTAGLRAFRAAATLADVVPTVRIRIRDGDRHLCSVSTTPGAEEGPLPSLLPCAFRTAVGQAWRLHRQGTRLRFLGMDVEGEPAVDIGLPTGGVVLPGQIYRFPAHDDRYLFCFMTELDVPGAERAVSESLATARRCDGQPAGGPPAHGARRVGFHADPVTELTAVHALCTADDQDAAAILMARLLEVCVAAEAIAELETAVPGGPA